MNVIKFIEDIADEHSCKEHLKGIRENQGLVYKKCGSNQLYWLKSKYQWQCAECNFHTTLKDEKLVYGYGFYNLFQKGLICKGVTKTTKPQQIWDNMVNDAPDPFCNGQKG